MAWMDGEIRGWPYLPPHICGFDYITVEGRNVKSTRSRGKREGGSEREKKEKKDGRKEGRKDCRRVGR